MTRFIVLFIVLLIPTSATGSRLLPVCHEMAQLQLAERVEDSIRCVSIVLDPAHGQPAQWQPLSMGDAILSPPVKSLVPGFSAL